MFCFLVVFGYIDVVMSSEDFYDDEFLDGIIKGWNILLWVVFCGYFMLLFFRNLLILLLFRRLMYSCLLWVKGFREERDCDKVWGVGV